MVRLLRIFQVLRLEKYTRAVKSLIRVVYHNREILGSAVTLAFILLYFTSTGLYYKNRHTDPAQYGSIPQTMYLGVLMLTGQGEPEGDMDAVTKIVVTVTALASVPLFGIFAAMLGWGFEAEAERFLRDRKLLKKKKAAMEKDETLLGSQRFTFGKKVPDELVPQFIPSDISSSTPVFNTSSHYETSSDEAQSCSSSSECENEFEPNENDIQLSRMDNNQLSYAVEDLRLKLLDCMNDISRVQVQLQRVTKTRDDDEARRKEHDACRRTVTS